MLSKQSVSCLLSVLEGFELTRVISIINLDRIMGLIIVGVTSIGQLGWGYSDAAKEAVISHYYIPASFIHVGWVANEFSYLIPTIHIILL